MAAIDNIPPFRMAQLMKIAGKITETMISNVYNVTYDEIKIILAVVEKGISESNKCNEKQKEEEGCF